MHFKENMGYTATEIMESDREDWKNRAEALERAIRSCPNGICNICANCKNKIEYCPDCINSDNWSNWVFDEEKFAKGGESGDDRDKV